MTYLADNGGVGPDIMIAQTTDSQGLDDGGTISVLVNIGSGGGTVGLKFEWYEPNSFDNGSFTSGSLLTQRFKYTTFDIDFKQLVQVQTSEITSYTLDGSTVLTAPSNGPTITFQDGGADSTVTNPTTAAQFLTIDATASHTITMGKQNSNGNALFMFEFRDPATVAPFNNPNTTIVPEPSSFGFIFGFAGLVAVGLRRRIR